RLVHARTRGTSRVGVRKVWRAEGASSGSMMGDGGVTLGIIGATCCRMICQRFSELPTSAVCHAERSRDISHCSSDVMSRDYDFWIYIVTNRNHSVLYIGVTNSFSRRICEHREGIGALFLLPTDATN